MNENIHAKRITSNMLKLTKTLLSFFIVSVLLTGCATRPSQSNPAPTLKTLEANPNSQMAKVVFIREYIVPILYKAHIKVDNEKVGSLKNNQYLEVFLEPGDHEVIAELPAIAVAAEGFRRINVKAGQTYFWEIDNTSPGAMLGISRLDILPVAYAPNSSALTKLTKAKTKN